MKTARRLSLAASLAFGLSAFGLSSCVTMDLEGSGMKGSYGTETLHGSLWGIEWTERDVTKCHDGHELYRVRLHDNGLHVLASALTLGLYVPQTVEWWCSGASVIAPPPEPENPEEPQEPGDDIWDPNADPE